MSSPFAYSVKLAECGSKHLALYLAVREAITEGKLAPGERLPSTRTLASLYGLSRGSVSLAYEMLTAEGFVQAGIGQGTFVAGLDDSDGQPDWAKPVGAAKREPLPQAAPALTGWARRLMAEVADRKSMLPERAGRKGTPPEEEARAAKLPEATVSFVPEGVGRDWFPWTEWKAEVAHQWKVLGETGRAGLEKEGSFELRKAIAERLRRERGISCEAGQVVVTGGSMQAIALLTQLLLEEGKTAVVENPCYTGIRLAVRATGARTLAQPVDANGIITDDWDAGLLFVTPTRHFPTGVVLSYERRRSLLAWAARRNAWIVEDDYDSDFRWGGRPIEPLKSLDKEGRVVYVGTFSRSMGAGVRIGYAVLPDELLGPFAAAKGLYDPYPTGIAEQQALASWMSGGGYDRYMRRMRRTFGKLERKLRTGIEEKLGRMFEVVPSDAGLHLYAKWKLDEDRYDKLVEECAKRGVAWKDGAAYGYAPDTEGAPAPGRSAVFGFAHLNEESIGRGVLEIRDAATRLGWIDIDIVQGGTVHA
ncbi:PLP-dependent aminotransferase family protein [Cohnella suwonensis]|uniref:PLP-dependent aminotransferase family protein n=1 Tax=Cohnella suwonensis TaxID=696072 RepID=A0ABW0LUQ0_9BACL